MVTAMDDAIGNVTESLKRNGMFENTLIIFTADVRPLFLLLLELTLITDLPHYGITTRVLLLILSCPYFIPHQNFQNFSFVTLLVIFGQFHVLCCMCISLYLEHYIVITFLILVL